MSPGFWLHHAALAWRQVFDRRLRPPNLSPTQFILLASAGWLATTSGRPPTQVVADHADADRMMASKVLQILVDRDLAVRQPDPADGPVKRLGLTPDGGELTGRGIRIVANLDEEMFGPAAIRCARPSRTSRPGPGPLPDPHGTRARNGVISTCPQRDSNPCRRLERAVS